MDKLLKVFFNFKNRKNVYLILFGILIALFSSFGFNKKDAKNLAQETVGVVESMVDSSEFENADGEFAFVKRVIDGDTIELATGEKVRYIGIDAPEIFGGKECFADESKSANRKLAEGKKVRLEKDVSETDKYGRLLRYVWVGEWMINEVLVLEGYATANTYPPDVKYQEKFSEAEKLAREEKLGLWGEVCLSK